MRHFSSSATRRYASFVSKSAGGSLNAMCPFSPKPMHARSIGAARTSAFRRAHSASGSAASPLTSLNAFIGWGVLETNRSRM